jgi:hypothetical protein
MRRDVSHSAASVVHGRRRRDVALTLLANTVEDDTTKDKKKHEAKCDGKADKNNEAQSHVLL